MTRIKICGLMRPEDAGYLNEAKPDFAGMILSSDPKFRRRISRETAEKIREKLDEDIKLTGVFVDQSIDEILSYEPVIDLIQLHGEENADFVKELKEKTTRPVIKAFKAGTVTAKEMNRYPADFYLIDSGQGTGRTFDWTQVQAPDKPWILAGGISSENVQDAICALHPYAVDLSSSIETDGQKDREKIIDVVRKVREMKENDNEER